VVFIVGGADGRPTPYAGTYLVDCDVDAHDGRGAVLATKDRSRAKVFADAAEAFTYWKRTSRVRPRRPDGKPNRPLTAYHIEILKDDTEPL
jgi:hypothetical protein